MEIQSSVGRREGRNSQNRVIDQYTIAYLLGRIPENQGGSPNNRERRIDGICSDVLYEAILDSNGAISQIGWTAI